MSKAGNRPLNSRSVVSCILGSVLYSGERPSMIADSQNCTALPKGHKFSASEFFALKNKEERLCAREFATTFMIGGNQTTKATASGWIGSALEYYDFFIYATAASLVFPQSFFPSDNPTVAIVASLATYGAGYVSRPIAALVPGQWG